jgi:hypothetical protein
VTHPPDFRELLGKGFEAIDAAEKGSWHDTTFDESGIPYVHCSAIAGCPREYVLKAAGEATDGNTVESHMNFAFGHTVHKVFEDTLNIIPEFEGWTWIGVEKGGVHTKMPLTGKPDACLMSPVKQPVMLDFKSELGGSAMREKNAKAEGAADVVRHEHKLQVTGGAMIYEDLKLVTEPIELGMILYFSRQFGKNQWNFNVETFPITSALRAEVARHVTHKAMAWLKYQETGELPPRLAPMYGRPHWNCAPRDADNDLRGKYCSARFNCFEKHKA